MDVIIKAGTPPNVAWEPWGWTGGLDNERARLDAEMADWAYEDEHDGWRIDAPREVVRGWVDSLRDERDEARAEVARMQRVVRTQAESFAKMERELAEARRTIESHSNGS